METLILSLQSFLNAQHFQDQPQAVALFDVVSEAGAPWKDRITVHRDTASSSVLTYPDVLRSALVPLIENAIHYGSHAEIAIAGGVISISDRGPGLADEDFPKLIEPFFRADDARGRTTGGFGLGIPTAHTLLQRFGGTLSFEPRAGGGLTAHVGVPRPKG